MLNRNRLVFSLGAGEAFKISKTSASVFTDCINVKLFVSKRLNLLFVAGLIPISTPVMWNLRNGFPFSGVVLDDGRIFTNLH